MIGSPVLLALPMLPTASAVRFAESEGTSALSATLGLVVVKFVQTVRPETKRSAGCSRLRPQVGPASTECSPHSIARAVRELKRYETTFNHEYGATRCSSGLATGLCENRDALVTSFSYCRRSRRHNKRPPLTAKYVDHEQIRTGIVCATRRA